MRRVIFLHEDAPPKPPTGSACNGCGVCCAMAPCPLGMLISRRRDGRCAALTWKDAERQYRCGLLDRPRDLLPTLLKPAAPWIERFARRSIAAGVGCDCDLAVASPADSA